MSNNAQAFSGVQDGPGREPLLSQPAFTPTRKMRVVCIGAGISGLMVAWKVQHGFKLEDELDLAIYDRNPEIGGTWYENTYPGASSDVPAHVYVFPFEGNPDWTSFYATQPEIQAYIKRTAKKWDLCKYVQLKTTIHETIWDEESGKWKILLEQNGQMKHDEADFIINGSGFLSKWKWPDIKGIWDFKGKLVHSARWDNEYDWEGKRVAVLGNGNSGIQVVANMQPKVARMVNYVRQPTWIARNFLDTKAPVNQNYKFSEEQKQQWRDDPSSFLEYRKELERSINAVFYAMIVGHPIQKMYEADCRARMLESMRDSTAEFRDRMIPKYHAGCRRITPGDNYLEALQATNSRLCWDHIERFTEKGIRTVTGEEEEFDMIVCATGFDSTWLPQWKLVGRDGVRLEEIWKEDPQAFFATQVDGLPNYGMINGPNSPVSHGSVPSTMSWTCDYLLRWIMRMNRENIKTVAVKKEAVEDFNEYSQEMLKGTVWSDNCRTRYKNGRDGGRITGVYAGSMVHFKNGLEHALHQGEHFNITWRSKNRFKCLGNGKAASDGDGYGDVAPYMDDLEAYPSL
ncbi:hypothetical protein VMCG_10149 [Cytospora schulzeri]|uniref:FAD/NAD(P)-binding domain-containing protein n=1 Tax=Cytospora schulzeri TaxID=448051 RepID=A0A423VDU5_9PEZI|nr:hypothetical protein VMCG_10149 [Valsa malicola]